MIDTIPPSSTSGQTEAETSGHREPISAVRWLTDPAKSSSSTHRRQRLVTSGTDGRVVIWQIALSHSSRLIEPLKAVALKATDIPQELKKTALGRGEGRTMHMAHPGRDWEEYEGDGGDTKKDVGGNNHLANLRAVNRRTRPFVRGCVRPFLSHTR